MLIVPEPHKKFRQHGLNRANPADDQPRFSQNLDDVDGFSEKTPETMLGQVWPDPDQPPLEEGETPKMTQK